MDRPLKQRLWGAAVLIALAVIFLPMLVKGPAPDSGVQDVSLKMPNAPDAGGQVQELPLGAPGDMPASGATGMPAAMPGVTASSVSAGSTPVSTTPSSNASPATAAGDYAVNFGSYGTSADADRVVQALNAAQLKGYSEALTLDGRNVYRVRVGPFASREAAEVARLQAVRVNNAVKADVVALDAAAPVTPAAALAPTPASPPVSTPAKPVATPPVAAAVAPKPAATPAPAIAKPAPVVATAKAPEPEKTDAPPQPKPAAKPAASGTGFAVQLGAFANADDATTLRDRARAAGFSATTETVKTDKGVLTRVRLGPVASRESADALKAQAQSKLGIGGVVRPQP